MPTVHHDQPTPNVDVYLCAFFPTVWHIGYVDRQFNPLDLTLELSNQLIIAEAGSVGPEVECGNITPVETFDASGMKLAVGGL